MKNSLWHFPWTLHDVPHALIDINRGCNVVCRSCYNLGVQSIKSLKVIKEEFEILQKLRKLNSISLIGGEILLHPDLCEIIHMIKKRNIGVELFTNGVLLTPLFMDKLKESGTDIIFVHIEQGQKRPDLPDNASLREIWELINEKTALIASRGIDVGLTMTVHDDRLEEMIDMIRNALKSEDVHYFLLTLSRDGRVFKSIHGDIVGGLKGFIDEEFAIKRKDLLTNKLIKELMNKHLRLTPFAYVGSNIDHLDIRWLSYVIGTINTPGQQLFLTSLNPSLLEKFYLWIHRLITGCYPFYQGQRAKQFQLQLLLNAITGGNFRDNMKFLRKSFMSKGKVKIKRIIFQNPANIDFEGQMVHCRNCPDAVIKNGRLVPVCIVDKII